MFASWRWIATVESIRQQRREASGRNAHLLTARFPDLPLSKVKEFHFQTRPLQEIEFRNVSLHRGQKSHVEIFIDGKRNVPKTTDTKSKARAASGPLGNSSAEKPAPRTVVSPGTDPFRLSGKVVDYQTGNLIARASVSVRRWLDGKVLQKTQIETDGDGRFGFDLPMENADKASVSLYFESPGYAPRGSFGYSIASIRDNAKLGRPQFFDSIRLWRAKEMTGKIRTPDGQPAVGIKVFAYSRLIDDTKDDGFRDFSWMETPTDETGSFSLWLTTPGEGMIWIRPEKFAQSVQVVNSRQSSDLGILQLQNGTVLRGEVRDAGGTPVPRVFVDVRRNQCDPAISRLRFDCRDGRTAMTDDYGRFEPLRWLRANTLSFRRSTRMKRTSPDPITIPFSVMIGP